MSPRAKARLRRIVAGSPEVMVKITGRTRKGPAHLKAHLDYITRNGKIAAEAHDGRLIASRDDLRELHQDWVETNRRMARRRVPNGAESVNLILSMPPGTPADRVEAAAQSWARETFADTHDWLMARHDDNTHPHVHLTVRAVGYDGRRLAPGPATLQQWRTRFAQELRRLGVDAEATPRQARGIIPKSAPSPVYRIEKTGVVPHVRLNERQEVRTTITKPAAAPHWSWTIQQRQENIRAAYLAHAAALADGDAADRQLSRDIQRFVANQPVPLTRQQALAVELSAARGSRIDDPRRPEIGADRSPRVGERDRDREPTRPHPRRRPPEPTR